MLDDIAPGAGFSYEEAFSRNLGWVTAFEQQMLRRTRIAIAGLGGVGGSHLFTLARLGFGAFNIADFDKFELANMNRQEGARLSSIGKSKSEVLAAMARDINPTIDLNIFNEAITDQNMDAFLEGVDVYVDSLDFFALEARRKIFARCRELRIPAITAAPLGMSTAYLIFMPDSMSFEDYFHFEGLPKHRQHVNFIMGLSPALLHGSYMIDSTQVDFVRERGPSTRLSCDLCAGVTAAQVLKLVLKRGPVKAAPWFHQFDPYRNKWRQGWMPGGNNNPWQRLKLSFAYRQFKRISKNALPRSPVFEREIEAILDQARWAPSGDNTQPWRFEIIDDDHVTVHLLTSRARAEDFYDGPDGNVTLLTGGVLLETMRLAASQHKRTLSWALQGEENGVYRIAVTLAKNAQITADPLAPFISIRSVDRKAYRSTALSQGQKQALANSLGDEFGIVWRESFAARWHAAALNAMASVIRLSIPETYATHRHVVDWKHNFSFTGIPARAIGLDRLTLAIMRWAMRDWKRMDFLNRFGGGTLLARLEVDLIPGLFCGAHFVIHRKAGPALTPESFIHAGQAIQRFWLTATSHGLVMQPSFAPLFFAALGRSKHPFTASMRMRNKATRLSGGLTEYAGMDIAAIAFMGRLGMPRSRRVTTRSVRQPLESLLKNAGSP